MSQQMLRHKETGELFIWTQQYSQMAELELVPQNIIADAVKDLDSGLVSDMIKDSGLSDWEKSADAEARGGPTDLLDKTIVAKDVPPLMTVSEAVPKRIGKK